MDGGKQSAAGDPGLLPGSSRWGRASSTAASPKLGQVPSTGTTAPAGSPVVLRLQQRVPKSEPNITAMAVAMDNEPRHSGIGQNLRQASSTDRHIPQSEATIDAQALLIC